MMLKNYVRKTTDAHKTSYYGENGFRHRTDGPAIEWVDGSKSWYGDGKRHRTDGPAVEEADGTKSWYVDGKLHRTDGPAVEEADGTKEWYVDGKDLTEEQFNRKYGVEKPITSTFVPKYRL